MYYYINMYKITSVKHCLDFCVVVPPPRPRVLFLFRAETTLCIQNSEGNPESV